MGIPITQGERGTAWPNMRILTVHDDAVSPGGSNNYRRQLQAMLRREGVDTALFAQEAEAGAEDGPTCRYRHRDRPGIAGHLQSYYFNPPLFRALRAWIADVRPDLIHLHHCYRFPASVLLACRGQAPVVQTVHDFRILCLLDRARPQKEVCPRCQGFFCRRSGRSRLPRSVASVVHGSLPARFLRRVMAGTVDRFIVPSLALEAELQARGFPTFFLPHPLDWARFRVTPPPTDTDVILFVGYLHSSKGVEVLIRAFAQIARTIPAARLEIVGDGPCEASLKDLCGVLGVGERTTFRGAVSRDQVAEWYRRARVFVLPSVVVENSPLTVYEAMASGRPVVASRIGGIPELVSHGETGYLFDSGDAGTLAKWLVEVLGDKAKSKCMGQAGRRAMERLCPPGQHVERYLSLARSLAVRRG